MNNREPSSTSRSPSSPRRAPRVCARVRGGLGNQLFIYATACALALRNGAELLLDTHSALANDRWRQYRLDAFATSARIAPTGSFFVSTPRYRRTPIRWASRLLPYARRAYVEQPWLQFVPALLTLQVRADVYLDGFWQSEEYFAPQADAIRRELVFRTAPDEENAGWLGRIRSVESVAVHCRRTDGPVFLPESYYTAAARLVAERCREPQFFVFSDDPEWSTARLRFAGPTWHIRHNNRPRGECEDFRLMTACRHFITANSTFSWWGAWLGGDKTKQVFTPAPYHEWGSATRLPAEWTQVAWR